MRCWWRVRCEACGRGLQPALLHECRSKLRRAKSGSKLPHSESHRPPHSENAAVYHSHMLDLALRDVTFAYPKSRFALRHLNLLVAKSTHTAVIGPAGAGASTLLKLVAGSLRPDSGEIIIGARVVNRIKSSERPLLYVTSKIDVPDRWSVQHALVAAVRQRTLDRIDRQHEYDLAVSKWELQPDRTIGTLSPSERTLVHLARIELLKPGILIADRLLEHL